MPGVSPDLLRTIKLALIAVALVLISLNANRAFLRILSNGIFGAMGLFLVVLASAMGFLASSNADVINVLISYTLVFLMLWGAYAYYGMVVEPNRLLVYSAVVMAGFCALTVLHFLIGFPAFKPPAIYDTASLATAGFGAKRTGWSNGIALFVPLSFLLIAAKKKHSLVRQTIAYSCPVFIVGSQMVCGGRGGLVASFIALGMITAYVLPRRLLVPFIALLVVFSFAGLFIYSSQNNGVDTDVSGGLKTHFRLDRLESNREDALDRFSAGRLGQYACAWEHFLNKPITGHGFTLQDNCMGDSLHNLWLRLSVQGGVFLVAFLFVFVFRVVKRLAKNYFLLAQKKSADLEEQKRITVIYLAVIFQGLFISLVEPKALIGSFQATAVWWVVLGFSLFQSERLMRAWRMAKREQLLGQKNVIP